MPKTAAPTLVAGVDTFTSKDLAERAAASKGLKLAQSEKCHHTFCPDPLATYVLDEELLAALAKDGIRRQERPDCRNEIFTLVDGNPQAKTPGYAPSDYWNFKKSDNGRGDFDLRITLSISIEYDYGKTGFTLVPKAYGPFVSPADHLPHARMFRALVCSGKRELPAVAREIASFGETPYVVTWTDIGLMGLRRMNEVFNDFVGGNTTIQEVACSVRDVFDPNPRDALRSYADREAVDPFVAASSQQRLIDIWRMQLRKFRRELAK